MNVLFATAELAPVARVGGLAEAAGGLVAALRKQGVTVNVVLPDYGDVELQSEARSDLGVPDWAKPMWIRQGIHPAAGELTLVGSEDLARTNPYVDTDGRGWPDNDLRFMKFSAAVAALRDELDPHVVHLNDWHTAASIGLGRRRIPTVLTIHTLAYQGQASDAWLSSLSRDASSFHWSGTMNPLAGGIRLAERVIAVSPTYAAEVLKEPAGMGLHGILRSKGTAFVGILNGIDTDDWNPGTDPHIAETYSERDLEGRAQCRVDLERTADWEQSSEPIIGMVSRLVDQKGIDLLVAAIPLLAGLGLRVMVLGSGSADLARALHEAAGTRPQHVSFREGYDLAFAHKVFAGSDLFVMPSRFEPCGLAQMQAMRYGSIPVVTPVGGLLDTVIDSDASAAGTGFVAASVDTVGLLDALSRGSRALADPMRRLAIQHRGMQHDWSWTVPATQHVALYEEMVAVK